MKTKFFPKIPNRLIHEKSPYLLQHAYNPVDWYPWGEDAFQRARSENKPILLSIGYSTCHWCHVMENESFSDPAVAAAMAKDFVSIKVDREERPDLDKIYITAVSSMTGSAGWPLNVFLTPELKPFYGGTYFPPQTKPGAISWPDLLTIVAKAWNDPKQRQKILNSANEVTNAIDQHLSIQSRLAPLDESLFNSALDHFLSVFDGDRGGFSNEPKFPSPSIQDFLLFYFTYPNGIENKTENKNKALTMATVTLQAMARGVIYYQVGGGFHRYATDRKWHIPHFEKMLYDNSQLIINYLSAFQITKDSLFKEVAKETIGYVLKDMTHPKGGFYSAQDADSFPKNALETPEMQAGAKKVEGAYYVWELGEIENILGETDARIFAYRYGINSKGNVEYDSFGEFNGKNILLKAHTLDETAKKLNLSEKALTQILTKAKMQLLISRGKRPRPHLDDKIITSWNGLMISALARAFQMFGDEKYLIAAQNAATFIRKNLSVSNKKNLYHIWREGEGRIHGLANDYAFLTQALIDLFQSDFDHLWLDWALELTETLIKQFYDAKHGGFFMTRSSHDKNLIFRVKEDVDSVIPSADSVAVSNLLRLSQLTGNKDFSQVAEKTLQSSILKLKQNPVAAPQMLVSLGRALINPVHIIILGNPAAKETRSMLKVAYMALFPAKMIILVKDDSVQEIFVKHLPFIASMKRINHKTTTYLCMDQSCKTPITDPAILSKELGPHF